MLLEPELVVALPRVIASDDRACAYAPTALFGVCEQLVGFGNRFRARRKRFDDSFWGQFRRPVGCRTAWRQKVVLAITVEPDREDFGQAVDAAFARNRDVALRVEAGRRLAVMLEGAAAKRADAATMERA